jgi:pseudouridine synthase
MRLNKFIAAQGICSRRKADALIEAGEVAVNGSISTLGVHLKAGDLVEVSGEKYTFSESVTSKRKMVYLALNKPAGIEATCSADVSDNLIDYMLSKPRFEHFSQYRLYPIGRLDKASRGLLLITNDGNLTHKLTHPSFEHKKTYHVRLEEPITEEFLMYFGRGAKIEIKKGVLKQTQRCEPVKLNSHTFEVSLHQGFNQQIRKLSYKLGNEVVDLRRIAFAGIQLKDLRISEGDFCELEYKLIQKLGNLA